MKDHFAAAHEAKLLPRDRLNGARILPQLLHLRAKTGDVTFEFAVLLGHAIEFGTQETQAWHTLLLKKERWHGDKGQCQQKDRQCALQKNCHVSFLP